jgi:hypothetical protein
MIFVANFLSFKGLLQSIHLQLSSYLRLSLVYANDAAGTTVITEKSGRCAGPVRCSAVAQVMRVVGADMGSWWIGHNSSFESRFVLENESSLLA